MLAVIAIPEFDAATAAWIATIRAAHDPLQDRLAPHVTLMFPAAIADEAELQAKLESILTETVPFDVTFDRLDRMDDPHQPKYRHLNILLPDAASAAKLDRLHRALTGSSETYMPHLTISRFGAAYSARALKRQLGGLRAPVGGCIGALQLVRIEHGNISIQGEFPIASSPRA